MIDLSVSCVCVEIDSHFDLPIFYNFESYFHKLLR